MSSALDQLRQSLQRAVLGTAILDSSPGQSREHCQKTVETCMEVLRKNQEPTITLKLTENEAGYLSCIIALGLDLQSISRELLKGPMREDYL